MKGFFLHVVTLILIGICTKNAMPKKDGAPLGACESMTPAHMDQEKQTPTEAKPSADCPFQIKVTKEIDPEGKMALKVHLSAKNPNHAPFKGFMVQARQVDDFTFNLYMDTEGKTVGEFEPGENSRIKSIACSKDGKEKNTNTMTHSGSSADGFKDVSFLWKPKEFKGKVQFFVTFVEDYHNFWVKIPFPTKFAIFDKVIEQ